MTTPTDPAAGSTATEPHGPRISARVRILLWLLLVMAVALAAVAMTTRSLLLRDVDNRIGQLLTQETREFANFVHQGVDPKTGGRFTDTHRLLEVFLQRQYSDPDEELLGLTRAQGPRPRVIRQPRDFPPGTALHQDSRSLIEIFASDAATGTLERAGAGAARAAPAAPAVRWPGRKCRSPGPPRAPSWSSSTPSANGPSSTRRSASSSPSPGWRC